MTSQNGQSGSPQQPGKAAWRRRMYAAAKCAKVPIEGRADAVANRRAVLFMIATSANMTDALNYGRCWWTNEEFARNGDMPINTVWRSLAALKEQGLIRIDLVRRRGSVTVTRYIILDANLLPEWTGNPTSPKESGAPAKSGAPCNPTYPRVSGAPGNPTSPKESGAAVKRIKDDKTRYAHTDTRGHARTHAHEGDGSLEVPVPAHESRQAEAVDAMVGNLASGMTTSPRHTRHHAQQRPRVQPAQQRPPQQRPRDNSKVPQSAADKEANRAYIERMLGLTITDDDDPKPEAVAQPEVAAQPGTRAARLRAKHDAKFDAAFGDAEEGATLSTSSKNSEV